MVASNRMRATARKATSTRIDTGVMFAAKVPKSNPAAEPMRRFGGSPISVDAPPTFDARISAIR
jgi:hypothetical protein